MKDVFRSVGYEYRVFLVDENLHLHSGMVFVKCALHSEGLTVCIYILLHCIDF
jgi:hypothetical protein